ncbi:hypothetical protein E1287_01975 [Actinomadura sp. KC06]|uniref:AfsR/SARP family transcriptional regulator n=1 Tax=Actinomadura sp. KC06 TaxID=2530369 RepID=UPI00105006C9|nr:BTAD domain-containing putative transcriptional regulator [Actinomadura sp. KC06]TDD39969.1 hypothetical protein E1287_01975 [Actinomadura sp. KC06]
MTVCSEGRPISLPRRRRSLLGLLALRAGTVVTVGQLVDGLWGEEPPPTAVRTLHSHLAKLGATLAAGSRDRMILRRDPGYLLAVNAVDVDRNRFEELVADGRRDSARGAYGEADRAYRAALELWRGRSLADCSVHGWAAAEGAYLAELWLDSQEGLLGAQLATGTAEGAPAGIDRLLAEHPLRERLWELRMVAFLVAGRTAEALETYQRAQRTLAAELGVGPGAGLRHIRAGVLAGRSDPRSLLRMAPARHDRARR